VKVPITHATALLALLTLAATGVAATPAATIVVTNTNDSGAGSLRQAILDSNASVGVLDTITFNIAGSGVQTIVLTSALPDITDPVIINGQSQPGYNNVTPLVELNGSGIAAPNAVLTISSGNTEVYALAVNRGPDVGIRIRTNGGNTVGNCAIGTDPTGTIALGNATHGIVIENVSGNRINFPFGNRRNVIAGNGMHGVLVSGASATANVVDENSLGADWSGTVPVSSGGYGILIIDAGNTTVTSNFIGHHALGGVCVQGTANVATINTNIITANGGPGVGVQAPASRVTIRTNKLYSNAGLGIDLGLDGRTPNDALDADTGANNLQNYAVITKAEFGWVGSGGSRYVGVTVSMQGEPNTNYTFELNQGIEGRGPDDPQVIFNYISQISTFTTDASGFSSFVMPGNLLSASRILTGTITDPLGNTSELSPAFTIPDLTADSGACGAGGFEALLPLLLAALRRRRRKSR
jgi:hypothetical protein